MNASSQTVKSWIVRAFLSYGPPKLHKGLRRLLVQPGDTIMVHASWRANNGFRGSPLDFIAALKKVVGRDGLLTMTSLPYHNESSAEYLSRGRPMDVQRTPSRMGLLTEVFRRDREVVRSLSPSHPILAWGRDAADFVAGHEDTPIPFGPESPFGRLLESDGKILLVDAPYSSITFTHFLEDRIKGQLPVSLYEPEPMEGWVIDDQGQSLRVPTCVISKQANAARNEDAFFAALDRANDIAKARVGNTDLKRISCRSMLDRLDQLVAAGGSLFESVKSD